MDLAPPCSSGGGGGNSGSDIALANTITVARTLAIAKAEEEEVGGDMTAMRKERA